MSIPSMLININHNPWDSSLRGFPDRRSSEISKIKDLYPFLIECLAVRDLCRMSGVSKQWKELILDNVLWEKRFRRDFYDKTVMYTPLENSFSWKEYYKEKVIQREEQEWLLIKERDENKECRVNCIPCIFIGVSLQIFGFVAYMGEGERILFPKETYLNHSHHHSHHNFNISESIVEDASSKKIVALLIANAVQIGLWLGSNLLFIYGPCWLRKIGNLNSHRRAKECINYNTILMNTVLPITIGSLGVANQIAIGGTLMVSTGSITALFFCFINRKNLFNRVSQVFRRCFSFW